MGGRRSAAVAVDVIDVEHMRVGGPACSIIPRSVLRSVMRHTCCASAPPAADHRLILGFVLVIE